MENIDLDIRWYDELDSTNTEAARISESLGCMTVLAARYQTAGRGQRGNVWKASRGENLTFSIFLRFRTPGQLDPKDRLPWTLPAASQFRISQIATAAQCIFLERHGIEAMVKWPNDIYCGDRKISGMLVENSLCGTFVNTSVIGIGLNVNQTVFPEDLPNPVSMSLISGKRYCLETLLEEFTLIFKDCLNMLHAPGDALMKQYESKLYRAGKESLFINLCDRPAYLPANPLMTGNIKGGDSGKIFRGTICGVSDSGMLRIRLADGRIREFGFKEIAYII